ncbi:MAG: acyl carrier protein [Acidimicrobiia bacterium]
MDLRRSIITALEELFIEDELEVPELHDDLVLLDTELDSLGYAVLVTRLDERLGYDPFSLMEEPCYPETLGAFVAVYQRFAPTSAARE